MPKAKSALLASASGSLKDSLTFRALPQQPDIIMQQRPVPTDRRTAKQAAVRNAYSRLAYLWKNLSYLDKEPYQIMAEARNLTPWNCWLSFHLPLMRLTPKFYSTFSEGSGTSITDFAIGGNTGTLNGPVWQEKNQYPCLSFDGVDDYITFDRPGYYDTATDYCIFIISHLTPTATGNQWLISSKNYGSDYGGFALYVGSDASPVISHGTGTSAIFLKSTCKINQNGFNTIAFLKTGNTFKFYVNQATSSHTVASANTAPGVAPLRIGRPVVMGFTLKGTPHLIAIIPSITTLSQIAALDAIYRPFFA